MPKSDMTGKRVRLIRMEDPYTNLKSDDEGLIVGVDSMDNILVEWDNGSKLNLLPGIDEYQILEKASNKLKYLESFNGFGLKK